MSILINMEMPKNCRGCPCGYVTEGAFRDECMVLSREWEKDADSVRPNWCPLIEIKEPHGRLGDLDKMKNQIISSDNSLQMDEIRKIICEWLDDTETIIKAEGSET